MARVDLDAKQAVVERLRAVRASGKPLTDVVRFAAASLDESDGFARDQRDGLSEDHSVAG